MNERSALAVAIERRDWALAALCLLLGVAEAAAQLPPEALDSLLELLEGRPRGRKKS
jgi:hypothetical protein